MQSSVDFAAYFKFFSKNKVAFLGILILFLWVIHIDLHTHHPLTDATLDVIRFLLSAPVLSITVPTLLFYLHFHFDAWGIKHNDLLIHAQLLKVVHEPLLKEHLGALEQSLAESYWDGFDNLKTALEALSGGISICFDDLKLKIGEATNNLEEVYVNEMLRTRELSDYTIQQQVIPELRGIHWNISSLEAQLKFFAEDKPLELLRALKDDQKEYHNDLARDTTRCLQYLTSASWRVSQIMNQTSLIQKNSATNGDMKTLVGDLKEFLDERIDNIEFGQLRTIKTEVMGALVKIKQEIEDLNVFTLTDIHNRLE